MKKIFALIFIALAFPTKTYAIINIGNEYAFGDIKTLGEGVGRLTGPTFALATAAVVIYFLIGGVRFLLSGGNKEQLEDARKMIIHAIIGFVILMFAYLILQFLPQIFGFSFTIF